MSGLKGAESYAQLVLVCDFFDSTNDVNDVFFLSFSALSRMLFQ